MSRRSNKQVNRLKRAMASLLTAVMVFSCIPTYVMANETPAVLPETSAADLMSSESADSSESQQATSQEQNEDLQSSAAESTLPSNPEAVQPEKPAESSGASVRPNTPNQIPVRNPVLQADYILNLGTDSAMSLAGKTMQSQVPAGSSEKPLQYAHDASAPAYVGGSLMNVYTVYVEQGKRLKLAVPSAGNTANTMTWYKGDYMFQNPISPSTPHTQLGVNEVLADTSTVSTVGTNEVTYYYGKNSAGSTALIELCVVKPTVLVNVDRPGGYKEGMTATLSATASGFVPGKNLTYTWYRGDQFLQNGAELQLPDLTLADAGEYVCVVSCPTLINGYSVMGSRSVSIAVKESDFTVSLKPSTEETVYEEDTVTLTAETSLAEGAVYSYVWKNAQGNTLNDVKGNQLKLENLSVSHSGTYSCTVTRNINGEIETKTAKFTLVVQSKTIAVTIKSSVPGMVYVTQDVDMTAEFPELAGETYRYQWYKDNTLIPGEEQKVLSFKNLKTADSAVYRVVVSARSGETVLRTGEGSYSLVVAFVPEPGTAIENSFDNSTVLAGWEAVLTAKPHHFDNDSLTYQWYKDGKELNGQQGKSYTIPSMTQGDAGLYEVKITGKFLQKEYTVKGEYRVRFQAMNATKQNTVDTRGLIDVKMFNYNGKINDVKGGLTFINGEGNLIDGSYMPPYNMADAGAGAYQGLMSPKITNSNGLPDVKRSGISADYLFGTGNTSYRTSYSNASFLLQKNGSYFSYDSAKNHAAFDADTQNFSVWNFLAAAPPFDSGFFPFNKEMSGTDGTLLPLKQEKTDFWFGTSMEFNFLQPAGGVLDGNEMEFRFTGDDDIWIYVDDILFLDLGGIHPKVTGVINFAKGTVTVDEVRQGTVASAGMNREVSFEQLLRYAGVSANELSKYLMYDKTLAKYTTFKNYSEHDLKFFYLERGAGASNCSMMFNMPPVPQNTVNVIKQIENINDNIQTELTFKFQMMVNDQPYANQPYNVLVNGTPTGATGVTDANGYFMLQHGQGASFANLTVLDEFEVIEHDVLYGEYEGVQIDWSDTNILIKPENGNPDENLTGVTTGKKSVADVNTVVFKNICNVEYNTNDFILTKTMPTDATSQDSFVFEVLFDGRTYAGTAYLQKAGTNSWERITVNRNNPITLQVGDQVKITDLPAKVAYRVIERNPSDATETYLVPKVTTSDNAGMAGTPKEAGINDAGDYYVDGKTYLGFDSAVTVINEKEKKVIPYHSVTVHKTIDEMDALQGDAIFFFRLENEQGDVFYRQVRFDNKTQDLSVTFDNLPSGTYTVTEEQPIRYAYSSLTAKALTSNATVNADASTGIGKVTFDGEESGKAAFYFENSRINKLYFTDTDLKVNGMQIQRGNE